MKSFKQLDAGDMTQGRISEKILLFSLPLMAGNILQQFYNIADTIIVGKYIGETALAAVGSAYTLMIFLTSVICGLCMGSGVCFSIQFGMKNNNAMKQAFFISFVSIAVVTVVINVLSYVLLDKIIVLMHIPKLATAPFRLYLSIIFAGIPAVFIYNFYANLLRSVGNSLAALIFLAVSTLTNVVLDLLFIICFNWGIAGAAAATIMAQYLSAIGIYLYYRKKSELRVEKTHRHWDRKLFCSILNLSVLTCVQQSVMNFGILMVQGLVNSFGVTVMVAFTAGVKIDTLAYSPVQDFGNGFATFVAQNYGAGRPERIRAGIFSALKIVTVFCIFVSMTVFIFAEDLMQIFVDASETQIINTGVQYLRVEGSCYIGIGLLFLLYGFYRAVKRPIMSVILTVISLGTRVVLAYTLSAVPSLGTTGIWIAIPVGWLLADIIGVMYGMHLKVFTYE